MITDILKENQEYKKKCFDKWNEQVWNNSFLGHKSKSYKYEMAHLLTNQVQIGDEVFRRIAVPVAFRVASNLHCHNLVSIQTIGGDLPHDKHFYLHTNENGSFVRDHDDNEGWSGWSAPWDGLDNNFNYKKAVAEGYQNQLDYESELCAVAAEKIATQIDREMIGRCERLAVTRMTWDASKSTAETIKERYEDLHMKIVEVSNEMRKLCGNGANWLVASPEITSIYEVSATHCFGGYEDFGLGVKYCGKYNNRWRVYKDMNRTSSSIVLGYKGDSNYDAGLIWCPKTLMYPVQDVLRYEYDIIVPKDGGNYFAVLDVENF